MIEVGGIEGGDVKIAFTSKSAQTKDIMPNLDERCLGSGITCATHHTKLQCLSIGVDL